MAMLGVLLVGALLRGVNWMNGLAPARYELPGQKGAGVSVTPHQAGRMLGSAVWSITKDNEELIYAVDCNRSVAALCHSALWFKRSRRS